MGLKLFGTQGKLGEKKQRSLSGAYLFIIIIIVVALLIKIGGLISDMFTQEPDPQKVDEELVEAFSSWTERKTGVRVLEYELLAKEANDKVGMETDSMYYYYTRMAQMCVELRYVSTQSPERKKYEYDYAKKSLAAMAGKKMSSRDSVDYKIMSSKLGYLDDIRKGRMVNTESLYRETLREQHKIESVAGHLILADVAFSDSSKARVLYAADELGRVALLKFDESKYHTEYRKKD